MLGMFFKKHSVTTHKPKKAGQYGRVTSSAYQKQNNVSSEIVFAASAATDNQQQHVLS